MLYNAVIRSTLYYPDNCRYDSCFAEYHWLLAFREDSLAALGEEEIIKKFPRMMHLENATTLLVLKTPKTESSIRKVWMPKTVAYILREWRTAQDKQKEFLGGEYQDHGLVVAFAG